MAAPSIVHEPTGAMLAPLALAMLTAWLFWDRIVPRQLRGLQVAFKTSNTHYEVHRVTHSVGDVKHLLRRRGTRFGVASYLMALAGILVLLFDFLLFANGGSEGMHAPTVALGVVFIVLPALVSSGTSLGAQVIRPLGTSKATLQNNTQARNAAYLAMMLAWLGLALAIETVLEGQGVTAQRRYSLVALFAFSPAVLAYGRILGSSWNALKESSSHMANGRASPFHNHVPTARQQFVAQLVHLNLVVMPFVAINTLVSVVLLLYNPDLFTHSDRVLALPEYRLQSTYMEEGGLLGFWLIELFAHIPEEGIRVPMVTAVLLFLLMNVAIVGFLFVYEVARILFLDVQDFAGRGGIRLADSRLLRAEPVQQATVLNFCFTGFAGQSMLLLALAMVTFWDSTYLPQGAACGTWESSMCAVLEKNTLEELTWMLAAGGQIAFLVVWSVSRGRSRTLSEFTFDASMDEDRTRLRGMSDMIYLKQRPINDLIGEGDWQKALSRFDEVSQGNIDTLVGLDMIRRAHAGMVLNAGLGRWDEAEELAIDLLAIQGGRDAESTRLFLCAASLAQRDLREAEPRLDLLPEHDVEGARLRWFASLMNPKRRLEEHASSMLAIDPVTRENKALLEAYATQQLRQPNLVMNKPVNRMVFLGHLARLRLDGQSERALDLLEAAMKTVELDWVQAKVVQCLLNMDAGRVNTAVRQIDDLATQHPRHPHVRAALNLMATLGHTKLPPREDTNMQWATEGDTDWRHTWSGHNVSVPPSLDQQHLREHAWQANAWVGWGTKAVTVSTSKKAQKQLPNQLPLGLHLHLSGVVTTIQGQPIDLGFPGSMDLKKAKDRGLLD